MLLVLQPLDRHALSECAMLLLQNRSGVTFAPHQLATYTTPNFYMGDAAAAFRDASSTRPSQANHPTAGVRSAQALHAAMPQSSGAVPAKSSTSHPALHAEPSFSHGVAFPGKRKWSQDDATDGALHDKAKLHAHVVDGTPAQQAQKIYADTRPGSQLGRAGSASAANQVLTAGMPV